MNSLKKIFDITSKVEITFHTEETTVNFLVELFLGIKKKKKKVFFIGNGGSAGIAVHMTIDYLKNGGIRTHSMLDSGTVTCLGNDFGYEYIFSKQLELIADEEDLLVAISSSGESMNIINAVAAARDKGCVVVTLSGFRRENKLRQMGDYNLYVPSMEYGVVESIHNMILQEIVDRIVARDGIGIQ